MSEAAAADTLEQLAATAAADLDTAGALLARGGAYQHASAVSVGRQAVRALWSEIVRLRARLAELEAAAAPERSRRRRRRK